MYSTSITPSSAPERVGPQHCLRLWTRQLVWSIVYNRKQWHTLRHIWQCKWRHGSEMAFLGKKLALDTGSCRGELLPWIEPCQSGAVELMIE